MRKPLLVFFIVPLLLCLLGMVRLEKPTEVKGDFPVFNVDTGKGFVTIQDGINDNETLGGHTIKVSSGTFFENVVLNKSVTLLGQDQNTTVIYGNGSGTVVQIAADNVTLENFTMKNGGKTWTGLGYPDSCIRGIGVQNVTVENNTVTGAAVCTWFSGSSLVKVSHNVATNATTMGIVGYSSSNMTISHNSLLNCGIVGLHLDTDCSYCNITGNRMAKCVEGLELEKCGSRNSVEENNLFGNNLGILVNGCESDNSSETTI